MNVRWMPSALQDRIDVFDYLSAQDPGAGIRMDELFKAAAESLAELPLRGRAGRVAGTRELIPHPSYRLV
jgi:plasmid stabilization system protein ParE